MDITEEHLQLTMLVTEQLFVISIYRSNPDRNLATYLKEIIPSSTNCLVIGDFNLGSRSSKNHEVFKILQIMGFLPLVSEATHIDGGHLDHAWLRLSNINNSVHSLDMYSPYYNCKDHDVLLFCLFDPRTTEG